MTTELVQETCTPCRGGVPPLTAADAARYLVEAPGLGIVKRQPTNRADLLVRESFREALARRPMLPDRPLIASRQRPADQ